MRAAARLDGRAAAATGISGADQLKTSGKGGAASRARYDDLPILDGLAQGLEHTLGELWELVEEEHTVMRKAHLTGMGHSTSSNQPSLGRRVVRRTERPLGHESALTRQETAHTPDDGDLDRFLERERRKDGAEPAGQHGLSRAGRADHEDVVAARRGDLQ